MLVNFPLSIDSERAWGFNNGIRRKTPEGRGESGCASGLRRPAEPAGRLSMTKTNAMRLLDAAGIPYRTAEYEYDESDLSGRHAAEQVDMPAEQVFKTLVTRGDKTGLLVFCIPVLDELDLRRAAQVSGNKRLEMIHVKELLPLTGYMRGGCSPIGMKKKYPTYLDETYILFDEIAVSAGMRGEQIILNPEDLARYLDAKVY